ncbi:hypothetical protein QNI19_15045 [Cytophagaceae bacterium DM2B3-1]|uniref:Uncharacterized protein n=1 Tax=Xanthocytophaga flava TaxID=3048013 RepID=A0ABT7CKJ6_9BACT|nr:hypothetical protein [Xanthocytophaga flavus]MDJ1494258.1 hypothetical protein [Xanthocytophaga flavus]
MKIGFAVHFFDFRNDVRKVIQLVNQQHEVVLFVRKADEEIIRQHAGNAEIRIVDEHKNSFINKIWDNLFRFFGKLPKSRQNFYLMEYFKISLSEKENVQQKAYSRLNLSMKLPRFLSYDTYLKNIRYKRNTEIDDIDQFICFTDISDSYFFSRLIQENKKVKVYVYSWDHPCKHVKYSDQVRYLVWHEGLKQDLIDLQNIEPAKIHISGSSQFAYVYEFLQQSPAPSPYDFNYIYFGCAIGIPALTVKEIQVIEQISRWLQEIQSPLKLVVRPYPVLTNWSYYENLKQLPNVVLDDQFRSKNLSVGEEQIYEKYNKITHAEAFIHLGTTMGLEACFIDTPSVILDFPEFSGGGILSLSNFVHQFQNDKYLMSMNAPNIIHSAEEFKEFVQKLQTNKQDLLAYNKQVVKQIKLKSFGEFAQDLVAG